MFKKNYPKNGGMKWWHETHTMKNSIFVLEAQAVTTNQKEPSHKTARKLHDRFLKNVYVSQNPLNTIEK